MAESNEDTLFERWKKKLLNNKWIVIAVFIFIVVSSILSLKIPWPFSSDNKEDASSFVINGIVSPYVQYGGHEVIRQNDSSTKTYDWCTYKSRFNRVNFKLFLGDKTNQAFSNVTCIFEENPIYNCNVPVTPNAQHSYTSENIYVTDETDNIKRVQITYISDRDNKPTCQLTFDGVIKRNKLQGELKWVRQYREDHPNLQFTIYLPITQTF